MPKIKSLDENKEWPNSKYMTVTKHVYKHNRETHQKFGRDVICGIYIHCFHSKWYIIVAAKNKTNTHAESKNIYRFHSKLYIIVLAKSKMNTHTDSKKMK